MYVNAFIQNRKNSKYRNKYNEKTLAFIKTAELLFPATYQYGFIPGTVSDDGDCIDIWVISETDYEPGKMVKCRVLGVLEMFEDYHEEHEEDFKVFGCPANEKLILTEAIINEIKNYTLEIFKKFPEVKVSFGKFLPPENAGDFIKIQ